MHTSDLCEDHRERQDRETEAGEAASGPEDVQKHHEPPAEGREAAAAAGVVCKLGAGPDCKDLLRGEESCGGRDRGKGAR